MQPNLYVHQIERVKALPHAARYILGVGIAFAALGLTMLTWPFVYQTPLIYFMGAITVASWLGGLISGLFTTFVSIILMDYFIISAHDPILSNPADFITLAIFALVALLISWLEEQRRAAVLRAQQSHDEMNAILNSITDAITVQQPDGTVVFANHSATRLTNNQQPEDLYAASPVMLHQRYQMRDEQGKPLLPEALPRNEVARTGQPASRIFQMTDTVHNTSRWVHLSSAPVFDAKGAVRLIANVLRDITAEKEHAEALLDERRRLYRVLNDLHAFIAILTPDGTIIETNKALQQALSATAESLNGQPFTSLAWWQSDQMTGAIIAEMLATAAQGQVVRRDVSTDGEPARILDITIAPIMSRTNRLEFVVVSGTDVTERKMHEVQLAQINMLLGKERQRLSRILHNLPGIVYEGVGTPEHDNQRMEFLSDFTQQLLGYPPKLLQENPEKWREIIHPDDWDTMLAETLRIYDSGQASIVEFRAYTADGALLHLEARATPFTDDSGQVIGVSGVIVDVTRRKRAENALRSYAVELNRSNAELEQFAYVASHDLQEPLRMVGSYLQLLEQRYSDALDEDAREFIAYAVDGASRMKKLIQDLLAYSRVQRSKAEHAPVSMQTALERALDNLAMTIKESNAVITHDPLPTVHGNESQLAQVFQNLISNAIKFRGDQPPRVHIAATDKADHWEIAVRDNGIGIEAEYLERIFVIFQRLHSREQYEGTGIGLAICRKIVQYHGGQIWAQSTPGEGTTFSFTIPKYPEG
jgi:PAS domain S-box-containing protein